MKQKNHNVIDASFPFDSCLFPESSEIVHTSPLTGIERVKTSVQQMAKIKKFYLSVIKTVKMYAKSSSRPPMKKFRYLFPAKLEIFRDIP